MRRSELFHRINVLRQTDNHTSWFYLLREYLSLALIVSLMIAFYHWSFHHGWNWLYAVPLTLVAIVLIGAGQHRLATLGHEASHYLLFRNRVLNELASDWLCMFPLWSLTHYYRLQHLAHHQYPNDPRRDPDVLQLEGSGHRFRFPLTPRQFVWRCVIKQALWVPGLIAYIRMRARYAATGGGDGPYCIVNRWTTRVATLTIAYLITLAAVLTALAKWGPEWSLLLTPAALLAPVLTLLLSLPESCYHNSRLKPVASEAGCPLMLDHRRPSDVQDLAVRAPGLAVPSDG